MCQSKRVYDKNKVGMKCFGIKVGVCFWNCNMSIFFMFNLCQVFVIYIDNVIITKNYHDQKKI